MYIENINNIQYIEKGDTQMATKKPNIAALVDQSMEGRGLAASSAAPTAPAVPPAPQPRERFKPAPKQAVMIRFDEGDYGLLQRIAERKGTKASALIRQAVKEIIKAEGGS
jgi:hypothetical protein